MGVLQFITTLETNIEKLSGSPVQVSIDSISAGSVKVASTVVFLNGNSNSAAAYQTAMTSGTASSSIFGTSFGAVAVDASSVKPSTVANPSKAIIICLYSPEMHVGCHTQILLAALTRKHGVRCCLL